MLGRHLGTVGLSLPILKAFLKLILRGLDFLHEECHIIHTGKFITSSGVDWANELLIVARRPESG